MRYQKLRRLGSKWFWLFVMVNLALGLTCTSLKADGTWARKADMPTARGNLWAGVVDDVIYAVGGGVRWGPDANDKTAVVEAYDPATDTWTKKADMPTARDALGVSVVNGKIYAIGGFARQAGLASAVISAKVEAYDPATDTWTKKTDMPTRRAAVPAIAVNGIIYVIGGGKDGLISLRTVEAYNPATDTWTKKADMPTARWATAAALDGVIYVFGGEKAASTPTLAVEAYNPATDTWTKKADMPPRVVDGLAVAFNERIYLVGPGGVYSYDPATDTWRTEPNMLTPRIIPSLSVVNGRIYAIGGIQGGWLGTGMANVEEFSTDLPEVVSPQGKLPELWGTLRVSR